MVNIRNIMNLLNLIRNRKKRKEEIIREIKSGEYTIWSLLFPKPSRAFFFRLGILILGTWLICKFLLLPLFINGASMEPTYPSRGFVFCFTPAYWFSEPKRGDIMILRYAGHKVMLLKRLIAFEGETVEFRNGVCYINGVPLSEPYVKKNSNWNLPPRQVSKGHIYVMGDNRSMPIEQHMGGEISKNRIQGKPLW